MLGGMKSAVAVILKSDGFYFIYLSVFLCCFGCFGLFVCVLFWFIFGVGVCRSACIAEEDVEECRVICMHSTHSYSPCSVCSLSQPPLLLGRFVPPSISLSLSLSLSLSGVMLSDVSLSRDTCATLALCQYSIHVSIYPSVCANAR